MNSLTQLSPVVKTEWLVLNDESDLSAVPDGVYEFDDPCDRWVVVLDGKAVNWAVHQSTAWNQYAEALRIRRDHIRAGNSWGGDIPFDGRPQVYEGDEDDYGLSPAF